MDTTLDKTIRRLGPTPRKVLGYVIQKSEAVKPITSAGTISHLELEDNSAGGGYSVLSRNGLVEQFGRDDKGNLRWKLTDQVEKSKEEVTSLITRLEDYKNGQ
jgi:hypothetical protein